MSEGFIDKGLKIVKSIRQRYNGENRNPWNEMECGSNYARSMASFGLMNAYSGFRYDMTKKQIGFNPIQNGTYLWSVGETYGTVSVNCQNLTLNVLGTPLDLSTLLVENCQKLELDGKTATFDKTAEGIEINQTIYSTLTVTF